MGWERNETGMGFMKLLRIKSSMKFDSRSVKGRTEKSDSWRRGNWECYGWVLAWLELKEIGRLSWWVWAGGEIDGKGVMCGVHKS